jgi:hypothetical protein
MTDVVASWIVKWSLVCFFMLFVWLSLLWHFQPTQFRFREEGIFRIKTRVGCNARHLLKDLERAFRHSQDIDRGFIPRMERRNLTAVVVLLELKVLSKFIANNYDFLSRQWVDTLFVLNDENMTVNGTFYEVDMQFVDMWGLSELYPYGLIMRLDSDSKFLLISENPFHLMWNHSFVTVSPFYDPGYVVKGLFEFVESYRICFGIVPAIEYVHMVRICGLLTHGDILNSLASCNL